jgi:hypothetical protein
MLAATHRRFPEPFIWSSTALAETTLKRKGGEERRKIIEVEIVTFFWQSASTFV